MRPLEAALIAAEEAHDVAATDAKKEEGRLVASKTLYEHASSTSCILRSKRSPISHYGKGTYFLSGLRFLVTLPAATRGHFAVVGVSLA